MTAMRARLVRLERALAHRGSRPATVQIAEERMEARRALCDEAFWQGALDALHDKVDPQYRELPPGAARRFARARRLLRGDFAAHHRADVERLLAWERRTRGRPGPLAAMWGGNWTLRYIDKLHRHCDDMEEMELQPAAP